VKTDFPRRLDAQQPELSGIPVIAVTAPPWSPSNNGSCQSGCNACISKPIDFKLLSRELDKWLAPLQIVLPRLTFSPSAA